MVMIPLIQPKYFNIIFYLTEYRYIQSCYCDMHHKDIGSGFALTLLFIILMSQLRVMFDKSGKSIRKSVTIIQAIICCVSKPP